MNWRESLPETLTQYTQKAQNPSPGVNIADIAQVNRSSPEDYGMVTCTRCKHFVSRICLKYSTRDTTYRPLSYEPVMEWRRCSDYRSRGT